MIDSEFKFFKFCSELNKSDEIKKLYWIDFLFDFSSYSNMQVNFSKVKLI